MDLDMINDNINSDTITLINDFMNHNWNRIHISIQHIFSDLPDKSVSLVPKFKDIINDINKRAHDTKSAVTYRNVLYFSDYPKLKKVIKDIKPNFATKSK